MKKAYLVFDSIKSDSVNKIVYDELREASHCRFPYSSGAGFSFFVYKSHLQSAINDYEADFKKDAVYKLKHEKKIKKLKKIVKEMTTGLLFVDHNDKEFKPQFD